MTAYAEEESAWIAVLDSQHLKQSLKNTANTKAEPRNSNFHTFHIFMCYNGIIEKYTKGNRSGGCSFALWGKYEKSKSRPSAQFARS